MRKLFYDYRHIIHVSLVQPKEFKAIVVYSCNLCKKPPPPLTLNRIWRVFWPLLVYFPMWYDCLISQAQHTHDILHVAQIISYSRRKQNNQVFGTIPSWIEVYLWHIHCSTMLMFIGIWYNTHDCVMLCRILPSDILYNVYIPIRHSRSTHFWKYIHKCYYDVTESIVIAENILSLPSLSLVE